MQEMIERKKMKKTRLIFPLLLSVGLAACSTTQHNAPVTERTIGGSTSASARQAEDRTYYTVKKGDTLYRIALDFGQSYSELVTWNNLANPNDIKVGQVLRVAQPDTPVARSGGAQVGAVTTSSGVETRSLSAPAPAAGSSKTEPRGDKRPYSDATMAGMKGEGEKPAEAAANGDEGAVSWMWPADGKVISNFDDSKKGIDIAGKSGQPVLAAGAGKVMYAGSGIRGYGNLVIVKHTSTLLSAYAHNKTISVKEGQTVSKGQKIAEMGDSDADAVKLHFEIRQQGKPVDPTKFLPARP